MFNKKKFYVYVDESGQDTKGLIFVVSVLIMESEREFLADKLEKIEKESGKNNLKWHKARREYRQEYIKGISHLDILRDKIFFETFSDTKKYLELTAYAAAKAILRKSGGDYKATVFVDGLRKKELAVFTRGLRDLKIKTKRWLQNYFCCNLSFSPEASSSWRKMTFTVAGLRLNHFAGFPRLGQKVLNFA